jgi:hypothetical protein
MPRSPEGTRLEVDIRDQGLITIDGQGGTAMNQYSDTRVVSPDPRQAQNAVRTLRGTLESLELGGAARSQAARALDEIEDELRMPEPDRGVVTARLERFTELVTDGGEVDETLSRRIRTIAAWVGPMGVPVASRLA